MLGERVGKINLTINDDLERRFRDSFQVQMHEEGFPYGGCRGSSDAILETEEAKSTPDASAQKHRY